MAESYRILMVAPTSFFLDYGCHVRILEESRALQRLGHKVTVLTYYLGRDLPDLEIVRTRPTPWHAEYEVGSSLHKIAFDTFLLWRGLRLVLRRPFDLIHGHLHEGALIGRMLSRLAGLPLVADLQGSMTSEMVDHGFLDADGPWYRWIRLLERRINHLPDALVTSTQMTAILLEQDFGCAGGRVYPVPDSVSLDFFRPDVLGPEAVAENRAALGIPAGRPIVAYLGLLADYQGTSHLVEAAQVLKERAIDAHFLVMGFPNVERYRHMATDLGVGDRITFTGKVPYEQAPANLALGDVAVAPKLSATEGAGKILNYMAMELPTVAFDTPVSREYLGSLGVYASPCGDAAALADTIGTLLATPGRCRDIGRKLRRRAGLHYSWDRAGRHLLRIYQTLLGEPSIDGGNGAEDWEGTRCS